MSSRRQLCALLLAALMVAFMGVRLWGLAADPPPSMPNGRPTLELIVEPIAKAHEARNAALFGAFATHPVDNYRFWRPQSPAWVYPLSWFFRAFGTSTLHLRAFALLGSTLGYGVFLCLARRRLRGLPFFAAAVLFGFNCYQVAYSRVGLLEPQLIALVTLSALALVHAERRPLALCAALLAFTLALFTKQSAAFFAPVLLYALVRRQRLQWAEREGSAAVRALPAVCAVALLAVTIAIVRSPEYLRCTAWNFGHVVMGETQHRTIAVDRVPFSAVLARPFDWQRWQTGYFLLFPVAGPLALVRAATLLPAAVRRSLPVWEGVVLGFFLCALAATLLAKPEGNRFELILYPPVALLAGSALQALGKSHARLWSGPFVRWAPTALLLAAVVFDGGHLLHWARHRTHVMAETRAAVARALAREVAAPTGAQPKLAVVIGLWAGPLVFDTPHVYYYVKESFNASKEALVALGPTHFLLFDRFDPTRSILTHHFPERMKRLPEPQIFPTARGKIAFYPLGKPLP